jgi:hypothetical protein
MMNLDGKTVGHKQMPLAYHANTLESLVGAFGVGLLVQA